MLLTRLLAEARTHAERPLVGRGQCVEYVGAAEAYMPVLDAIGGLCRDHREPDVTEWLARYAPTWLLQLPALATDAEIPRLRERTLGSTAERMMRSLANGSCASRAGGVARGSDDSTTRTGATKR